MCIRDSQLPQELYPDGTAIMNTLQQIAGAIGTAVAVSFMSFGQAKYIATTANPTASESVTQALTAGIQTSFFFVFAMAIIAFICTLLIKRVKV